MAHNRVWKPFGEDALAAIIRGAKEASDSEFNLYRDALPRQVSKLTFIPAVNSPRRSSTLRTAALSADWP
jgi:hypothetical protein